MPDSKLKEAEARAGMPLHEYFVEAVADGRSIKDMADELGVCRETLWRYMKLAGWERMRHIVAGSGGS